MYTHGTENYQPNMLQVNSQFVSLLLKGCFKWAIIMLYEWFAN